MTPNPTEKVEYIFSVGFENWNDEAVHGRECAVYGSSNSEALCRHRIRSVNRKKDCSEMNFTILRLTVRKLEITFKDLYYLRF